MTHKPNKCAASHTPNLSIDRGPKAAVLREAMVRRDMADGKCRAMWAALCAVEDGFHVEMPIRLAVRSGWIHRDQEHQARAFLKCRLGQLVRAGWLSTESVELAGTGNYKRVYTRAGDWSTGPWVGPMASAPGFKARKAAPLPQDSPVQAAWKVLREGMNIEVPRVLIGLDQRSE